MTTEQAKDDGTELHRNPRYISQLTRNTFAIWCWRADGVAACMA